MKRLVVVSFRFSREKGESIIEPANNHGGVIVSVAHIVKFMLLFWKWRVQFLLLHFLIHLTTT